MRNSQPTVAWTCILLIATLCSSAGAGSGNIAILPANNGKKLVNGIIAKVDSRWTDGWGYRPVRVTLSVRKTNKDRNIQVVLLPNSYSKFDTPLALTANVEIPQGEREVTETIYVPQQQPWSNFRTEFFENGRKLKDLSMDMGFGWNTNYGVDGPRLLMVDSDAPGIADDRADIVKTLKEASRKSKDVRLFDLPDAEKFQYLTQANFQRSVTLDAADLAELERSGDLESLRFVATVPNLEILPPTDLPLNHVGLSGIDLIIISLADLTEMSESEPARFKALDFHIRAGGNLVVYGEFEVIPRTESLLKIDQPWTSAKTSDFTDKVTTTYAEMESSNEPVYRRRRRAEQESAAKKLPPTNFAPHGLGLVVTIQAKDPYEQSVAFWQWVLKTIGFDRLTWSDRHGISLVQNNPDYWDFMIPGFGAAPVKRFLGVICMFIIVIGPVNFYLLRRARRLYLLPITVGLAAFLTTIAMLAYAVVSDGISTRVRLRSYTLLDQKADHNIAATHCRHSYLAAIAPSDGLIFPNHTCVYPILPYFDHTREREETVTRIGKRVLGRGYLRSRSTTQFLSTDVLETEQRIEVNQDATGRIEDAKNMIGVTITHAWIRDGKGELFQARQVAPEGKLSLELVDGKDARTLFNKIAADNRPKPPPGLDKGVNRTMFGDLGSRRYYYYQSGPVYSNTSILAKGTGNAPKFFTKKLPNTYLLITETVPPFVATGTSAEEEAGYHIIEGRW